MRAASLVDVGDPQHVERLRDLAYEAFGEVAVLMNNAGVGGGAACSATSANGAALST